MVDAPRNPPQNLDEELEDAEDDLEDVDDEIRALIDGFREETDASLRIGLRFSGDDADVLFVREDIADQYSEPELEQRIEALVVKGLGDPPREESLQDFGRLDATIRWYDEVLVASFPVREWSGFVFTFDRQASPIVDLARKHLQG